MKPAAKAKAAKKTKPTVKPPAEAARKSAAPTPKKVKNSTVRKASPATTGLEFREFEALRRQLDLSLDDLSSRLGLSPAVVAQRKAAGRLTTDESGKVVCFARLLGHAVHHFGDLEEARRWLKAPQRGLHGAVPLDYAKTDLGAREVENLLVYLEQKPSR